MPVKRLAGTAAAVAVAGVAAGMLGLYGFNNVPLMGGDRFERRLDDAIDRATAWVRHHRRGIVAGRNNAMFLMLRDCHELSAEPLFAEMVDELVAGLSPADPWRRLFDAGAPLDPEVLDETLRAEPIDNRWMLYAVAPDQARLTEDERAGLLDGDRWSRRVLNHQLLALVTLRESGVAEPSPELIERVGARIAGEAARDPAVVDLYIQRIAFLLYAGQEERVSRRWVERVIENQAADGGWNDRWCGVFRSRRRPSLEPADPPSNEHATIQGLWLLYQVRHRCPDRFGLRDPGDAA